MSERPVECGQCKKPIKFSFKEIEKDTISQNQMCADCPILQQRLYGDASEQNDLARDFSAMEVYCAHCHTPIESIKMGGPMGCSQCYQIFNEFLIQELVEQNRLPANLENSRQGQPLHIGKTPDQPIVAPEKSQMQNLNEALNEALTKENYEEAAWIRDQIKQLMEGGNE